MPQFEVADRRMVGSLNGLFVTVVVITSGALE
jgi:hypothetical protein